MCPCKNELGHFSYFPRILLSKSLKNACLLLISPSQRMQKSLDAKTGNCEEYQTRCRKIHFHFSSSGILPTNKTKILLIHVLEIAKNVPFEFLRQKILLFHTLEIFRKISTPERYILPKLEVWYVLIILSTDLIDMHIMNLTRRYRIKTRSLAASCLMSAEHHLFHYHMQIEFKEFPVKYNQSSRIILH